MKVDRIDDTPRETFWLWDHLDSFQRYSHSKFSKMAASRHLEFGPTGSWSIRSADLENPTTEPKMNYIK